MLCFIVTPSLFHLKRKEGRFEVQPTGTLYCEGKQHKMAHEVWKQNGESPTNSDTPIDHHGLGCCQNTSTALGNKAEESRFDQFDSSTECCTIQI